jgi:hypothetical protein
VDSDGVVYREDGAWWQLWLVLLVLAGGIGLDAAGGALRAHAVGWLLAVALVAGLLAVASRARARTFAVRLTGEALQVGRETVLLGEVDAARLRESGRAAGPVAGTRVLGGAWSVPRGRSPMPLPLNDGTTVVVPTRDPDALRAALLAVLGPADRADGRTDDRADRADG